MSYVSTTELRKNYGEQQAVAGVDLAVAAGEIFGLLGPNGAGKSTTIQMISGVIAPTSGRVMIDGRCLADFPRQLKELIGYVPQELALYDGLSARENLRFFASPYRIRGRSLASRIDWALSVAGLEDRSNGAVKHFSGGMKRRLNLVAGLLHRPKLLILDEPTVGIDPQSRNFLFKAIRRLRDEEEMTVLYTSHYLEEVEQLCDRVAILDHGQVVACDSVEALVGHGVDFVRIEFDGPVDRVERLVADCEHHGLSGRELRVTLEQCATVLERLRAEGIVIHSIRSVETDLESVFLRLTGAELRDEGA